MDNNSVREKIIRLRKNQNLSQAEMAERLGISRTAYRSIESGVTRLINDKILKIADILNADPAELFYSYDEQDVQEFIEDERSCDYLSAVDRLKRAHREEIAKLSEENNRLKKEVESLKYYIATQHDLVKTKDEIITLLKQQISHD